VFWGFGHPLRAQIHAADGFAGRQVAGFIPAHTTIGNAGRNGDAAGYEPINCRDR
jgi:hypothetical protein